MPPSLSLCTPSCCITITSMQVDLSVVGKLIDDVSLLILQGMDAIERLKVGFQKFKTEVYE